MRNLELTPKSSAVIHGFLPEELNNNYARSSIFVSENPIDFLQNI